jgi:diguanylate cyclase (GGDEF)-like protein
MGRIKWDKIDVKKLLEYSAIAVVILFVIIHIYLGVFYLMFHGEFMFKLNIASFAIIAISGVLAYRKQYQIMFRVIFIEAIFHMFMATVSFGWACGFQNYLIALVVLIYYIDYCSMKMGASYIRSSVLAAACFFAYILAYIITAFTEEPFLVPDGAMRVTQLLSSVLVFATVAVFLWVLIQFTFRIEDRMSVQAHSDKLTGLPNRYYFTENYNELEKRCTKEHMFMAIMDIDDFKKVNDTYGHNAGDYVLKTVATIIQNKCKNMVICRWGGEEFLISGEADGVDDDARRKICRELDNIRKSIGNHDLEFDGNKFRITLTMGVAFYGEGETVEDWIGCADKKLYSGKISGKNKLVS